MHKNIANFGLIKTSTDLLKPLNDNIVIVEQYFKALEKILQFNW